MTRHRRVSRTRRRPRCPTHIRCGSVGWGTMVWRIRPPAPGRQVGREGWFVSPSTWVHVLPPSLLRNRPAGSTPAYSVAVGCRGQAPDRRDRRPPLAVTVGQSLGRVRPGLSAVLAAPDRRAVPRAAAPCQDRPARRLDDQVVDRPALAQRPTQRPVLATRVALEEEGTLRRADEELDISHDGTSLGGWRGRTGVSSRP